MTGGIDLKKARYISNRTVLLFLLMMSIMSAIISLLLTSPFLREEWLSQFFLVFSAQIFGSAFIYIILELVLSARQMEEGERQQKQKLILQLGSSISSESALATRDLRIHSWLEDGTLRGANLRGANLKGNSLGNAVLSEVDLSRSNLENVDLRGANLYAANLKAASLMNADLANTNLQLANLESADLRLANLSGTNLAKANLKQANLDGVLFDETTILPDFGSWNANLELDRFTNREHPDFWTADDPISPAYRQ